MCESELQKGWYGVRAKNGFAIGGKLKRSIYFEVLVAGTGVSRIGWSYERGSYNLGTDFRGWGYGGTAKKSHEGEFTDYGEGYRKGDVIGCALDLSTGDLVYFKNGRCMGVAFTISANRNRLLYPTVAVRNMKSQLNFGANGYAYEPEQFKKTGFATKGPKLVANESTAAYVLDINIYNDEVDLYAKSKPKLVALQQEKVRCFVVDLLTIVGRMEAYWAKLL
jgi:hypothetical protein